MIAFAFGKEESEADLIVRCKTVEEGTTIQDLENGARAVGLDVYIPEGDLTLDELASAEHFAITYILRSILDGEGGPHAVLIEQVGQEVLVLDPKSGRRSIVRGLFEKAWTKMGKCCLLIRKRRSGAFQYDTLRRLTRL